MTQVVYAASLNSRLTLHKELFSKAERLVSLPEYLTTLIADELRGYTQKLAGRTPQYYIDPRLQVPAGITRKLPNPIDLFLSDSSGDEAGGLVAVLLAEPGQGKTFMCDHLVSRSAQRAQSSGTAFAPIYIRAEQWATIGQADLASLSKTLTHCFRYFETPIPWVDGNEELFLQTTLKAGIFRIVFDGFDEYVLKNRGEVGPVEIIGELCKLAESSGARIVVTSRSSFWTSEVEPDLAQLPTGQRNQLLQYRIEPFDQQHARNYFSLRLKDQKKVDSAATLFQTLSARDKAFVGRGFFLSLIADLFEGDGASAGGEVGKNPLMWMLRSLCERERRRQDLPLTAEQQLNALTNFAVDTRLGSTRTAETVDLAIAVADEKLDDSTRRICVQKLSSHPLLTREQGADRWAIAQDQTEIALLARHLMGVSSTGGARQLDGFSQRATLERSTLGDLAAMIIKDLPEDPDRELESARRLMENFLDSSDRGNCLLPNLAMILGFALVDAKLPKGSERKERTDLLMSLLPRGSLSGLRIDDSVSRFDFSEVIFERCQFENVRWNNCRFSKATIFRNCKFVGGGVDHCDGFGGAVFEACEFDHAALSSVQSEQVAEGVRAYTRTDLERDVGILIMKFAPKGGFVLKSVRRSNLYTGPFGKVRHRSEILEELERSILEDHRISQVAEGGLNVKSTAEEAVRFYATNNVFVGPLKEAVERLARKLGIPGGE
ncbi:MAG: NACHT domain-containing protein [Terricaulis sp.]